MRRMRMIKTSLLVVLALLPLRVAFADEGGGSGPFSYNVRVLLLADMQDPAVSTQNPDNAFLQLNRYSAGLALRPDLYWEQPSLNAVLRPRYSTAYRWWRDGMPKGRTDSESRAFVNEGRVQAKLHPALFLSFGKEKLLWGPSFLAAPSNTLFRNTEKANPKSEVEGKYLAKAIFAPGDALTVSVISETRKDRNGLGEPLAPLRLLKLDVVGSEHQVSLIGYLRRDDRFSLGSYGQWTASDALLLYYDGIVARGSAALYPVADAANPLGGTFARTYEDSSRLFPLLVAGGAYTFLSGDTFSLEALYQRGGYGDAEAEAYYRLRGNAGAHFSDAPLSGVSGMTLAESLNTGLPFLRRYYVMGQLQVREIGNVLDVILRYTRGLEEHAGQASTILEWRVTDRVQLFSINTISFGREDTEFRSVLAKMYLAGAELHF